MSQVHLFCLAVAWMWEPSTASTYTQVLPRCAKMMSRVLYKLGVRSPAFSLWPITAFREEGEEGTCRWLWAENVAHPRGVAWRDEQASTRALREVSVRACPVVSLVFRISVLRICFQFIYAQDSSKIQISRAPIYCATIIFYLVGKIYLLNYLIERIIQKNFKKRLVLYKWILTVASIDYRCEYRNGVGELRGDICAIR
jgi:hypothetical protein